MKRKYEMTAEEKERWAFAMKLAWIADALLFIKNPSRVDLFTEEEVEKTFEKGLEALTAIRAELPRFLELTK